MIFKRTKVVKIFCFTLFLLTNSAYAQSPQLTPKQVDMGEVKSQAVATFWVHNPSEVPFVITKATSDCSCTKLKFSKKPVMAGDSTKVTVRYNPTKDEIGTFYKTVFVYTSASKESLRAIIRGKNY